MEKAYRKKILQQAEKAAIDGNTLLAGGLKLLAKIYNEIDECRDFEKKAAKKADYEGAIKLQGMVDAWKKTAWELQKVLNLR